METAIDSEEQLQKEEGKVESGVNMNMNDSVSKLHVNMNDSVSKLHENMVNEGGIGKDLNGENEVDGDEEGVEISKDAVELDPELSWETLEDAIDTLYDVLEDNEMIKNPGYLRGTIWILLELQKGKGEGSEEEDVSSTESESTCDTMSGSEEEDMPSTERLQAAIQILRALLKAELTGNGMKPLKECVTNTEILIGAIDILREGSGEKIDAEDDLRQAVRLLIVIIMSPNGKDDLRKAVHLAATIDQLFYFRGFGKKIDAENQGIGDENIVDIMSGNGEEDLREAVHLGNTIELLRCLKMQKLEGFGKNLSKIYAENQGIGDEFYIVDIVSRIEGNYLRKAAHLANTIELFHCRKTQKLEGLGKNPSKIDADNRGVKLDIDDTIVLEAESTVDIMSGNGKEEDNRNVIEYLDVAIEHLLALWSKGVSDNLWKKYVDIQCVKTENLEVDDMLVLDNANGVDESVKQQHNSKTLDEDDSNGDAKKASVLLDSVHTNSQSETIVDEVSEDKHEGTDVIIEECVIQVAAEPVANSDPEKPLFTELALKDAEIDMLKAKLNQKENELQNLKNLLNEARIEKEEMSLKLKKVVEEQENAAELKQQG